MATRYIVNNLSAQTISGTISATTYYGDGSNLEGVSTEFIENVTYNQLWDKIINSGLTAGKNYRLTDYRTINFLHGQSVANNMTPPQILPAGSLDPSFVTRLGFSDSVHAIKEVELGSWLFTGSCKVTVDADPSFTIGTSDFTIEWFQYYTGSRLNNSRPFSIGQNPTTYIGMSFEAGETNYFWWNQNGTSYSFNLNTPIENSWCHFVVQRSGSTINIFQDGQIVYTGVHGDNVQNNDFLVIGNELNNGPAFEGYITNFKWTAGRAIYNGSFDLITKPLNPEADTAMLFKAMTKNKLLRNSFVDYNLSAYNNGNNLVTWSKETPFESERKIYVGGEFSMYKDDYTYGIARLNQDGTLDKTFITYGNNSDNLSGFSSVIKCIEIQDDGKILVGGNFDSYKAQPCGYLVRLLDDGSQDLEFETSFLGNGFDATVRVIVPLPDRSMIIGGSFTQYFEGVTGFTTNVDRICKLNKDGNLDQTYIVANGYSFNGSVYDIKPLDYTVVNPEMYIGGDFTTWTHPSLGIKNYDRIIKFIANWRGDPAFNVENGGFNNRVFEIAVQDDGKLVLVGGNNGATYSQYTYSGINYTANSIIRLNTDASVDTDFLTNVGTGFNAATYSLDLLNDGKIFIGGAFSSFNGTNLNNIVNLNSDGTLNTNFVSTFNPGNWIIKLRKLADENVLCGGWFSGFQNINGELNYIAKYITSDQDSGFIYSGVNEGLIEKIILKANSINSLEKLAFSEDYPQDILEYNPYVRNLGRSFQFYNGQLLPDSTNVTGFDLQWDGSKVYFDMPSGYTIAFGKPLYIGSSFGNNEWVIESSIESTVLDRVQKSSNLDFSINNSKLNSSIRIVSGGTRVYLEDLDFSSFTAYDFNSLNVRTELPLIPSYGLITNRKDTDKSVSVPFDFRNVKYRRYEMFLQNDIFTTPAQYYGLTDNFDGQGSNCTGRYCDFYVFGNRGADYYGIDWKSINYSFNDNVYFDNNVILGQMNTVNISKGMNFNTFMDDFTYSKVDYLNENIFNIFSKNNTIGNITNNRIVGNVIHNNIKDGFNSNISIGDININNIDQGFEYNKFQGNFIYNDIKNNCYANVFQYTYSNLIGANFSYNKFYSDLNNCNFSLNNTNNIFSAQCSNVNILSQNFINNNIQILFQNITIKSQILGYDFGAHNNDAYLVTDSYSEIITNNLNTDYINILSGNSMVYLELGV